VYLRSCAFPNSRSNVWLLDALGSAPAAAAAIQSPRAAAHPRAVPPAVSPARAGGGEQRAYAEEPAGAADKCPDLKEIGRKSRPAGFSVRRARMWR
jgi:hypothetical protein